MPDAAVEPFLVRQLGHPDPEVRRSAVTVLGRVAWPHMARKLLPAARDPDERVREAVAEELSRSSDPAARDILERMKLDGSRRVCRVTRRYFDGATAAE
jgi:HEAT repeat protein